MRTSETGRVEQAEIGAGQAERGDGVGDAVADQHAQPPHVGQPQQRAAARQDAVERGDAAEALGVEQAETIGQRRPFAEAGQVDAFGMDVETAAGVFDGAKDIVLDLGIVGAVAAPAERGPAVGPDAEGVGAAEADADVVAPAEARGQAQHLFVAAAVAVQKHHQRIGIVRLIAGGQEGAQRPAAHRLHFGGVEPLAGPEQTGGEFGTRHGGSDYSGSRSSSDHAGIAAAGASLLAPRGRFDSSRPAKSTIGPPECQRRPGVKPIENKAFSPPDDGMQRLGEVGGRAEFGGVAPADRRQRL